MMNIGVGSIITNGLGGPACNLLIFGPLHLYIEPIIPPEPSPTAPVPSSTVTLTPTPTEGFPSPTAPTPTPTPSSVGWTGGGHGTSYPGYAEDEPEQDKKYKLTFVVKFRGKNVKRTFIVDSFQKDKIIKRVGQINTLRLKFKVAWNKVKNNRFTTLWKK